MSCHQSTFTSVANDRSFDANGGAATIRRIDENATVADS
jgi:hypothetical protein